MFDVLPVTSNKSTDCGATCLKMILDYYGIEVDLNLLIRECNTRITGCSGGDIIRAARLHGVEMTAWQMDAEEVARQDRPSIIWWKYGHWCVCCGYSDDGQVVICNPDRGRYRMSFSTFKSFYTGVALFNGVPHDIDSGDGE